MVVNVADVKDCCNWYQKKAGNHWDLNVMRRKRKKYYFLNVKPKMKNLRVQSTIVICWLFVAAIRIFTLLKMVKNELYISKFKTCGPQFWNALPFNNKGNLYMLIIIVVDLGFYINRVMQYSNTKVFYLSKLHSTSVIPNQGAAAHKSTAKFGITAFLLMFNYIRCRKIVIFNQLRVPQIFLNT